MAEIAPTELLELFQRAQAQFTDRVDAVAPDQWDDEALPGWTVADLVAHISLMVRAVPYWLDQPAPDHADIDLADWTARTATVADQIAAYTRSHRGRNAADPNLAALQTAEAAANGQLNDANSNLSEATGAAQAGSTGSAVHVIDAPTVPLGPTSGMKRRVMAIVGGLFAGLVISFLAVVVLTPTRRDPWEDEPPAADWQGRAVAGGHATNGVDVRRPNAAWITTGAGALFVAPEADRDSRDHP
jgi:hypothetical protein